MDADFTQELPGRQLSGANSSSGNLNIYDAEQLVNELRDSLLSIEQAVASIWKHPIVSAIRDLPPEILEYIDHNLFICRSCEHWRHYKDMSLVDGKEFHCVHCVEGKW